MLREYKSKEGGMDGEREGRREGEREAREAGSEGGGGGVEKADRKGRLILECARLKKRRRSLVRTLRNSLYLSTRVAGVMRCAAPTCSA
jgi:hypothetical protein